MFGCSLNIVLTLFRKMLKFSKDVTDRTSSVRMSHLLLHQVFQLCDLVGIIRVADDVLLVKESLIINNKQVISLSHSFTHMKQKQKLPGMKHI